jgi:thioester reductase-like protein
LKKVKGFAFDDYISSKIIAVEGDLLKEGLGLSKEDENMITDNVNVNYILIFDIYLIIFKRL